jgi:hypothetical protein
VRAEVAERDRRPAVSGRSSLGRRVVVGIAAAHPTILLADLAPVNAVHSLKVAKAGVSGWKYEKWGGGLSLLLRMELQLLCLHLLYSVCDSLNRKSIGDGRIENGRGQFSVLLDLSVEFSAFVAHSDLHLRGRARQPFSVIRQKRSGSGRPTEAARTNASFS